MHTDEEGSFDVYVLQDAASMYIFGTSLVSVASGAAAEDKVDALFQNAWRGKRTWPKRLVLSDSDPIVSSFAVAAERTGIAVEYVPKSALDFYTNDVQAGFAEHFGLGRQMPPNIAFNRTRGHAASCSQAPVAAGRLPLFR